MLGPKGVGGEEGERKGPGQQVVVHIHVFDADGANGQGCEWGEGRGDRREEVRYKFERRVYSNGPSFLPALSPSLPPSPPTFEVASDILVHLLDIGEGGNYVCVWGDEENE